MTKFTDTIQSWFMPEKVVGKYANTSGSSGSSSHPVYIPALMPLISFGKKTTTSNALRSSCFCNDSKCKPAISGSIITQNYITVPVYEHQDFSLPRFTLGATMQIDALNGDYDELRISHKQDSSVW